MWMSLIEHLFNLATADLLPLFPQSYFWTLQSSEIIIFGVWMREFTEEVLLLVPLIASGRKDSCTLSDGIPTRSWLFLLLAPTAWDSFSLLSYWTSGDWEDAQLVSIASCRVSNIYNSVCFQYLTNPELSFISDFFVGTLAICPRTIDQ